jgi:cysteine desulfurase
MSDAVQALRTEEVRPSDVGVDMLTLSGHKIYGPKGIGAIFIDKSVEIVPLVFGGGQESGMRGGTENVPGIIGLGRAADILRAEQEKDREKVSRLQARFFEGISGVDVFGNIGKLMPGICYVSVFGEKGDITALKMDSAGIAVSSGSACDAGTRKSSSVLREAGVGNAFRDGGIRVSFGRFSEERDIDAVVAELQR